MYDELEAFFKELKDPQTEKLDDLGQNPPTQIVVDYLAPKEAIFQANQAFDAACQALEDQITRSQTPEEFAELSQFSEALRAAKRLAFSLHEHAGAKNGKAV